MRLVPTPWHAVPQHAQVLMPYGWCTVIDPRGAAATVVLRDEPTGRVSMTTVDSSAVVPMAEPETHDVIAMFAAAGMTAEIISEGAG